MVLALVSIIEFSVYALICYSGVLGLIVSAFRSNMPTEQLLSGTRVIWLVPCVICAILLMNVTAVQIETTEKDITIIDLNSSTVWEETQTNTTEINLQNWVWVIVHFLLTSVLIVYIITTTLQMLTNK